MDEKNETESRKPNEAPFSINDENYVLECTLSRFSLEKFGNLLVNSKPMFAFFDLGTGESRDFRRLNAKEVVEIVSKNGEPKILKYYSKNGSTDMVKKVLEEIINGR